MGRAVGACKAKPLRCLLKSTPRSIAVWLGLAKPQNPQKQLTNQQSKQVGQNLERLRSQSEDLLLIIEDEIRYIAKGEGGREGVCVWGGDASLLRVYLPVCLPVCLCVHSLMPRPIE